MNNTCEGYHNWINTIFNRPIPSLAHFIYEIRGKNHLVENEILLSFQNLKQESSKNIESVKFEKLRNITGNYNSYNGMFYLKTVASIYSVNFEQND